MCFSAQETQVIFRRLFVEVRRVHYRTQANLHVCLCVCVFYSLHFRVDQELWDLRESRDFKVTQWVSCIQIYALMNDYKITLTFAESFGSEPLSYCFCVCLEYRSLSQFFFFFLRTKTNQTCLSIHFLKIFYKYLLIIQPSWSIAIHKIILYWIRRGNDQFLFIFLLYFL